MAVLGRLLVSSAERLDLPDLLSLDSYAAGDWKYFLKGLVGDTKPYILKGFDVIDPGNAIGTQSCSIRVADSITFYPGSNSGSFFHGLAENHPQAAPLVPELRKNAVNYVYLTFSTFNTSVDTRAFWDPDKDGGVGGEFTQDINTESVLQVQVNVSTGSFPANTVPVAKITVGPVVITAIEDARDLMFRLGSGGINPNPFNTYGWRSQPAAGYERQEPPTQMLAGGVNPFQGADKNILTLKEWMDAIMSKLRELGGTTYWYDDTSSFSIITNFYDAVATAFKSKGKWVHDTTTPGLLTWTEDIQIKMTSDPRTYIIRQGSKQLADEQVMYIPMERNLAINSTDESVSWINGQPYVNTIGGAVGLFANLSKGDYVKKANDTIDKWVRVEEFYDAVNMGGSTTTAAGARSIRLGSPYLGGTGAEKGRYDKGVYLPSEVVVSDRSSAAIGNIGGNFHWLALRSDTIENVANIVTTDLSVAIDQHDGSTARVTSVAHGLVDGDRVTIAGTTNFDGTYKVEVETADIFYITVSGGPFADESGTGHYATVTTSARVTPYGFQEESANHGFNSDDNITINGTTNYDGAYEINVRNATTFTIPVAGPAATETAGTATLARVIVRTEGAVAQLIQGQIIDIGGSVADNIRQYIGMQSLSETAPSYNIPVGYNTLDGMQNYNGVVNENLTVRIAKLTAMMADKAQDKTVKYLPSNGITTISNVTNGAAQELSFSPSGASLTIATPSSDGQAFIALPDAGTPLSLLANQSAYVEIDRNNPTTPTILVADTEDVPLSENIFVLAVRLNTPDVYIWDGSIIVVGSQPPPNYLGTIVAQNQALKLVEGGTWSWDLGTETLTWDASAFVQIPGLANSVNSIAADSVVLAAGEVAYVDINRVGPGGALTVVVAANATLATGTNRFILARRETTDVIVGLHSMRLVDGESKKLYAATSDQTLTYIGATSAGDDSPVYGSNNYVTDGDSLTDAIGILDGAIGGAVASFRWKEPVANFAALPAVGNLDGDVRLTLDTRIAYSYHTATTDWRPLNGTGGGLKIVGGGTLSYGGIGSAQDVYATPNAPTSTNSIQAGAFATRRAVTYTPAATQTLNSITLRLNQTTIDAVNIEVAIYADSAGSPGTLLATSTNNVAVSALVNYQDLTSAADQTFTFAGLPMTAGTPYWVSYKFVGDNAGTAQVMWTDSATGGLQPAMRFDGTNWVTAGTGNTWAVINATPAAHNLEFDAPMYLEVKGLDYADNTIPVTESPITFPNNADVAYVSPNLTAGGPNLTVTVGTLDSVPLDAIIIARRDDTGIIVGSSSTRLIPGESKAMYTGVSDELLSVIPAASNADNTGIARLLANATPTVRVNVSSTSKVVPDGTTYGLQLKNLLMTFGGAQIDFSTGVIYQQDGVTPLGINFTPVTVASGQYRWYSVTLIPNTVNVDNTITGQLVVIPGSADGASAVLAPRAAFASTGIKLGQVVVQGNGAGINPIAQTAVVQMGTGGGGAGGTGDANELLERLKERLSEAPFEWLDANIFSTNAEDKIDTATATFDVANSLYKFTAIGQNIVSTQVLDPEFLTEGKDVDSVELIGYWNPGAIDSNATYEVSRNGGVDWNTITMARVGTTTDTFRGILKFPVDTTYITLHQWPVANATAYRELNATTLQAVGQRFTVTNTEEVAQQATLYINKVGSAVGYTLVQLVKDNGSGAPSQVLGDVMASAQVLNSTLAAGDNAVVLDWGANVLAAGDYHYVVATDVSYKAGFSAGINSVRARVDAVAPIGPFGINELVSGTWTPNAAQTMVHVIGGRPLDLRVRITSSAADVELLGYGVFYSRQDQVVTGIKNREVQSFDGTINNFNTFTLTNFLPDPDLLKVYHVETGQVYLYGTSGFSLNGTQVIFPVNTFNGLGTVTLVFDQLAGTSFDNSDSNAALLAANFLGSTNGAIDRSQNGRGIFLRRPDGTLREIAIDNSDNIVVYSV